VSRRLLTGVVTLALVLGVPFLLVRTAVRPGAALVKLGFSLSPLVKPAAGFSAVQARVAVARTIGITVPGAPDAVIDVYTPRAPSATPRPMVLWVHGGGFISGSRRQVGDYATVLADQGFVVASLEYSIAPGQRYPVPVRQGTAALDYLRANAARFDADAGKMFVGGDSAGAQISSELAAVQTNPQLAAHLGLTARVRLRGVLLFCGLYDMDSVGKTGFPALRTYLWAYTGHRNWTDYPRIDELSTTGQVTGAYPPTYLTVGDIDPFEPQSRELESVLRAHHVDVTTRYWTGAKLSHEYQFDLRTAAAQRVLTDTVTFIDGHAR
jgi:acetyl esterase/lipase